MGARLPGRTAVASIRYEDPAAGCLSFPGEGAQGVGGGNINAAADVEAHTPSNLEVGARSGIVRICADADGGARAKDRVKGEASGNNLSTVPAMRTIILIMWRTQPERIRVRETSIPA
jgi:hypothetical protein